MSILQVTVDWSGFTGAPGYTNLYFRNSGLVQTAVNNAVDAVFNLLEDIRPYEGNDVTWTISTEVKEIDETTGDLVALHSPSSTPTPVVGAMNDLGPIPAGICISWGTGGVHDGRPVRGRTFFVPMGYLFWDGNGSPADAALTVIRAAATAFKDDSGSEFVIWARPKTGVPGAAYAVTSATIRDKAAILTSRRD